MIALEDNFADVLAKAMAGLGMREDEAADKSGLTNDAVLSLLRGEFDDQAARRLAGTLGLRADALSRLGRGDYHPIAPCTANLAQVPTNFGGMEVNAYVLWDPQNRGAAIFDTGADATPLLAIVEREHLHVSGIFLTHSHADHVQALAALKHRLNVDAWSSEHEPVRGTRTFKPGELFNAGSHFIRTRHTPGHSPGGATFVVEGAALSAAIVGDALFAGSIGGVRGGSFRDALETIRREIFSLPEETILCPGHGPMTTVAQEKENNPFF